MVAHFIDVQRMAGIPHHRLGIVTGLEFALLIDAEPSRGLIRQQPLGHGRLHTQGRIQQGHGQSGYMLDQQAHHGIGFGLAGGIQHQPVRLRIDPHPQRALPCKGLRQ